MHTKKLRLHTLASIKTYANYEKKYTVLREIAFHSHAQVVKIPVKFH